MRSKKKQTDESVFLKQMIDATVSSATKGKKGRKRARADE
jgi:hypothetical protein